MVKFEFPTDVISNGRITIPEMYRKKYNIEEGDTVTAVIEVNGHAKAKMKPEDDEFGDGKEI